MPERPVTYAGVEVVEADGLGLTCHIGATRVFVGKYVPLDGTTVEKVGDRGHLVLPRWFVEQQSLPLAEPISDAEVEEWSARAHLRAAAAKEMADRAGDDAEARASLQRANAELAAATLLRARRHGDHRG